MAQNFLYMFEFVVDEVLITKPNVCAPEEYPTCCEISFRSSVFVSICDREFGECPDPCNSKCGKCCLFSLESEVTDKDRLLIHVYKKKTERCKFLLGATDLPIKPLFDRVTENFNIENPTWKETLDRHLKNMPDPRQKDKVIDNECDDEQEGRREQMCPMSELTKRLLPLFNMRGKQTGNIVLIMRLVCNGPTIVSSFPFSKFCATTCRTGECDGICPQVAPPPTGKCVMPDPCKKPSTNEVPCRRYFACNADKDCPCPTCEDEYDTGVCNDPKKKKSKKQKPVDLCSPCRSCGGYCNACDSKTTQNQEMEGVQCFGDDANPCGCDNKSDDCDGGDSEEEEVECCPPKPCFIELSRPMPGPEAYEEFEACLNGSGLKIRVLKDTHQVCNVVDGDNDNINESDDECTKCQKAKMGKNDNPFAAMQNALQGSTFARNQVKRSVGGKIINHPKLPKIRANIKYSGANTCPESFHVPFDKIQSMLCDENNKMEKYRIKGGCDEDCSAMITAGGPGTRGACMQIDPTEIKNALTGINADTRKKGIEVCYKACDETDSDVFLVKLGSKKPCEDKRDSIEIELKTPKQAVEVQKTKLTTETQVTGAEIDSAVSGKCGGKKKGGKGKKGKK